MFQVVRCFEDNDIVHVNGKIDPKTDIDVINLELVLSDLDQVISLKSLTIRLILFGLWFNKQLLVGVLITPNTLLL